MNIFRHPRTAALALVLAFVVSVSLHAQSGEQWARLDPIREDDYIAAIRLRGATLCLVGSGGTIVSSIDSGRSAIRVETVPAHLNAATASERGCVWIVGDSGVAYRTLDGVLWESRTVGSQANLRQIAFGSPAVGLIVAAQRGSELGIMLRTTDSGATWRQIAMPDSALFRAVAMRGRFAVAVGSNSSIFRSSDAGATWQGARPDPFDRVGVFYSVCFASDSVVVAAGAGWYRPRRGWIVRSSDAGATWSEAVYDVATDWLEDVDFATSLRGTAVGASGILETGDGGRNWVAMASQPDAAARIEWLDSLFGLAVGRRGLVRATTDGGRSWSARSALVAVRPYDDVAIDRDGRIVAVGAGGSITISDAAQSNLRRVPTALSSTLHAVAWTPSGGFVAVGDGGALVRGDAAGRLDVSTPIGRTARLNGIAIDRAGNGWIVGWDSSGAVLLKTSDGGETWATRPAPTIQELHAITMSGASDVWVAGFLGLIFHSTDGGEIWTDARYSVTHTIRALCALDRNNAVAVGDGVVMVTTDGGESWTFRPFGFRRFSDADFADRLHGILVGDGADAMMTSDGGATWSSSPAPITGTLASIAIAGSRVIGVSTAGEIVARDLAGVAAAPEAPRTAHPTLIVAHSTGAVVVTVDGASAPIASVAFVDILGRELARHALGEHARSARVVLPRPAAALFVLVTLADGSRLVQRLDARR